MDKESVRPFRQGEKMKQYLELGQRILNQGQWITIGDTNRITIYGAQMEFNLYDGFPIVTTRKIWWRGVVEELLWFLNGSTNVKDLQAVGVHIWDANSLPDGTIGDSYGAQWRNWDGSGYDQIERCIEMLEKRPKTTRNVVMAWNPTKVDKTALPPCHHSFQCLSDGTYLTLSVSMRSTDWGCGLPWNISSYALLTYILAKRTGLKPATLIMQLTHVHMYEQHIEAAKQQLQNVPLPLPELRIGELTPDLRGMKSNQFKLDGYEGHEAINYEMVVT